MTIKNQKQKGESLQPDFTDEEDEVGEEDATSGSPFFSFLFIFNNKCTECMSKIHCPIALFISEISAS